MGTPGIDVRRIESRITEEHLEIRAVVDRLQQVTDPNMMMLLLDDLHRKLDSHFLREEGDKGLYAIIETLAPQQTERVVRTPAGAPSPDVGPSRPHSGLPRAAQRSSGQASR